MNEAATRDPQRPPFCFADLVIKYTLHPDLITTPVVTNLSEYEQCLLIRSFMERPFPDPFYKSQLSYVGQKVPAQIFREKLLAQNIPELKASDTLIIEYSEEEKQEQIQPSPQYLLSPSISPSPSPIILSSPEPSLDQPIMISPHNTNTKVCVSSAAEAEKKCFSREAYLNASKTKADFIENAMKIAIACNIPLTKLESHLTRDQFREFIKYLMKKHRDFAPLLYRTEQVSNSGKLNLYFGSAKNEMNDKDNGIKESSIGSKQYVWHINDDPYCKPNGQRYIINQAINNGSKFIVGNHFSLSKKTVKHGADACVKILEIYYKVNFSNSLFVIL